MPLAYAPDFPAWCREFERYDIGPGTMLVGHSCGGGFLLRWLSEHPEARVGRMVLVAPWLDPYGEVAPDFFDFGDPGIDPALVSRTAGTLLFHSDDDSEDIQESVRVIRESVAGIDCQDFPGYGHFTREDRMGGPGFPALLDALVGGMVGSA
jgi:alpha-beta hydrolase superfamily lysophospholipase